MLEDLMTNLREDYRAIGQSFARSTRASLPFLCGTVYSRLKERSLRFTARVNQVARPGPQAASQLQNTETNAPH